MDELTSRKLRAVGAIAVLVLAVLSIFFIFYQIREKKNTSLRLRTFYSDMNQTLQFSINLNGTPEFWDLKKGYRNAEAIKNYLTNYLKVAENCVQETGECFPDVYYKNLADKPTKVNLHNIPSVKLHNGISIAFETISSCKAKDSICSLVYVDVNSLAEPNTFGKDLYVFMISNSKSTPFLPYNIRVGKDELFRNEKLGCNKTAELPMYCSAFLYDNNWQIDRNYPW